MEKKNKSVLLMLFISFLIWAVLANEFGVRLVTTILVIIILLIPLAYWRLPNTRNTIKNIYDSILNALLSIFESKKNK